MKIDDSLQITSMGEGNPRVVLLVGVHGDERSPLLVTENIKESKVSKGTLEIVKVNNLALKQNKRFVDSDLNRVFPGRENGDHEERLAFKLSSFLKGADLVIDLHCFHSKTKLTCIQFNDFDENVEVFGPEQIWQISSEFDGSIGVELSKLGIENFAIEMNCLSNLRQGEVSSVAKRIIAVLIKNELAVKTLRKTLSRNKVVSQSKGLFVARVSPGKSVIKGEVLGHVLVGSRKVAVKSPLNGEVMQVSNSKVCEKDDFLVAVGERK